MDSHPCYVKNDNTLMKDLVDSTAVSVDNQRNANRVTPYFFLELIQLRFSSLKVLPDRFNYLVNISCS